MKQILLFGAGKSSTALINYLLRHAPAENWHLAVADVNENAIREKTGESTRVTAVALDIRDAEKRKKLVQQADIVLSLLPPSLHILVANDCLEAGKNLLTASYIDESIRALKPAIEAAGLLFLCEMGLDPGLDHMSAKRLIDATHAEGGRVTSFLSHCGGLVAPESDDNPWHYKISWNPRNVVLAGKAGAVFRLGGEIRELPYATLFEEKRYVLIPGAETLCWYPNRDSLSYIEKYSLQEAETFIRTTLRHPDFMYGWKNLIALGLTDEKPEYDTDGKTLQQFFKEHLDKRQFGAWLESRLHEQFDSTKLLLTELMNLVKLEDEAVEYGLEPTEEFMLVNDQGDLQNIDIDQLKISAATTLADKMHDANLTLKQLFFLGMEDDKTRINKGHCSAADVLQFALEQKLMLQPDDRDLVVMLHELEHDHQGERRKTSSTLVLQGNDAVHTAMAKTVGLPLGVATKLILDGTIACKGLQIPVLKEIYEPVLNLLAKEGVQFSENTVTLDRL